MSGFSYGHPEPPAAHLIGAENSLEVFCKSAKGKRTEHPSVVTQISSLTTCNRATTLRTDRHTARRVSPFTCSRRSNTRPSGLRPALQTGRADRIRAHAPRRARGDDPPRSAPSSVHGTRIEAFVACTKSVSDLSYVIGCSFGI